MSNENEIKRLLHGITAYIRTHADDQGRWVLPAADLIDLLQADMVDFFRVLYELNDLIAMDLKEFSSEEPEQLAAFLSAWFSPDISGILEHEGIFLVMESRIDLSIAFITYASDRISSHSIRTVDFLGIYGHYNSFRRSCEIYFDNYVPWEDILNDFIPWYSAKSDIIGSEVRLYTLKHYLLLFLEKKLIRIETLYDALRERLRDYIPDNDPASRRKEQERLVKNAPDLFTKHCHELSLNPKTITLTILKTAYRELMKKYHPDINPRGLARAKEITVAYSYLRSRVG